MYPVSKEWEQECQQKIRQKQMLVRLEMGVFHEQAPQQCGVTFPQNMWQHTDGSNVVVQGAQFKPVVSRAVSGDGGNFQQFPYVKIVFSQPISLAGVTLTFGSTMEQIPQEIGMRVKTTNKEQSWKFQNLSLLYKTELMLEKIVEIEIQFCKTQQKGQRARLEKIDFGIWYEYTEKNILQLSQTESISPVSLELPRGELSFVLDDNTKIFDPDNEENLTRFLRQGQKMKLWYGMESNSSKKEWIPAGEWFLQSWTSQQYKAQFAAVSKVNLLTKSNYEKSVYTWDWKNIYNLIEDVFQDGGVAVEKYKVDQQAKGFFTMSPLPIISHSAALQLLANRCKCTIKMDRDGNICVVCLKEQPVWRIGKDTVFDPITVKKNSGLKEINGNWVWRSKFGNEMETIAQLRMKGDGNWVRLEHGICMNPQLICEPSVDIEAVHYARVSYLKINSADSEVTVQLLGNRLVEVNYPFVVENKQEGEILQVQNPLFDGENSIEVGKWMKDFCAKEFCYEVQVQGMPHLDVGDCVELWNQKRGRIVEIKTDYGGSMRQKLKIMA